MLTPTDAAFRISAARLRLMQSGNCGLLAEIGNALDHTPTEELPTCATDGKKMMYNPAYVDSVTDAELETTLLHEYAHVALLHPVRFDPKTQDQKTANQAMDYAANEWVQACGRTIPATWLLDAKYNGMAWEAIYTILKSAQTPPPPPPQPEPPEPQQGDDQPNNADQDGSAEAPQDDADGPQDDANAEDDTDAPAEGDSPADGEGEGEGDGEGDGKPAPGKPSDRSGDVQPYPSKDGTPADDAERSAAAAELTDRITRIAQAAEMAGNGSAGSRRFLDSLTTPRDPDLYEALAQLLERSPTERTWRRLNRRLLHAGLFAGADGEETPPLVIVIDTSGSINDQILAAFDGKIKRVVADFRPRAVTIIYCDSSINGTPETYTPDDLPPLTPHGGGGTDFRPPFNWVRDHMDEPPAALVYLTDLDGPAPGAADAPDFPVIWATIPGFRQRPPEFGQIVPILL